MANQIAAQADEVQSSSPGLSVLNPPRTSGYLISAPLETAEAQIFISSGSDMQPYRDLVDSLAKRMTDQAVDAGKRFRLQIRRWEAAAPRRTGGDGNREFRYDAANSHLVLVLLHGDLRDGTREELEEALDGDKAQVAVIWISPPPPKSRRRDVKWLHQKMDERSNDIRWEKAHTSLDAIGAIVGVLSRVLIDLASQDSSEERGAYSESR
ncbi:hypothetical protein [Williamsia herbipolensis]|uniref:hypothetical protein n=1 Tax=Williamsia herbipolensis TaxID=1603258 RepID=UPI00123778EB|nr:hypothetical protein [Williamsia herbipolensis]